jgi:signal transduction histidine kinase
VGVREPELLEVVRQLGMESVMTLPLTVRGRVLGAVTFVLGEGLRHYGPLEREVAEDLAGRVAMAVENAHLYQQAQRAIILRDEFLSIAAHELRTPLTAMELAVRMLRKAAQRGAVGERSLEEALEATQRQTARLEKLVESLLDVSRIQSGKLHVELQPLELGAVVREMVAQLEDVAQQAGSLVSVSAPESVMGRWDRSLLEQVVANLLENAVKYGAGRPITLRVGRERGHAVLEVSDQGIGIPPTEQERIFGRFERAVSAAHYGGLGLGLFIVRRAVERLGGQVRVRSEPGQGSTFTVSLPLEPPLVQADGEVHP